MMKEGVHDDLNALRSNGPKICGIERALGGRVGDDFVGWEVVDMGVVVGQLTSDCAKDGLGVCGGF